MLIADYVRLLDALENLKLDLFENQVFIFSPKADVYSLAAGSTPS